MGFAAGNGFSGRQVLVADEDPDAVGFMIRALREDGHAVFHAYDGRSALRLCLALTQCDLLISNTKVDDVSGVELIAQLRAQLPDLPILYLANLARSTPEIERRLPADVPILREPFGAAELRAAVNGLLARDGGAR